MQTGLMHRFLSGTAGRDGVGAGWTGSKLLGTPIGPPWKGGVGSIPSALARLMTASAYIISRIFVISCHGSNTENGKELHLESF
jgi:hypothetical protein